MQYSHIKKIEIKKNENQNQEETRKLNSNESNAE